MKAVCDFCYPDGLIRVVRFNYSAVNHFLEVCIRRRSLCWNTFSSVCVFVCVFCMASGCSSPNASACSHSYWPDPIMFLFIQARAAAAVSLYYFDLHSQNTR